MVALHADKSRTEGDLLAARDESQEKLLRLESTSKPPFISIFSNRVCPLLRLETTHASRLEIVEKVKAGLDLYNSIFSNAILTRELTGESGS